MKARFFKWGIVPLVIIFVPLLAITWPVWKLHLWLEHQFGHWFLALKFGHYHHLRAKQEARV